MFHLRLKQAEIAMRHGRLDEAATLISDSDVRDHRDGQSLLTRLIDGLLDRAESHLADGQLLAGRQDVQLARRLGGNGKRMAALLARVEELIAADERRQRRESLLLREAEREVEAGNCTLGEELLERAASDQTQAVLVGDRLAGRRSRIDSARERAEQLVAAGRNSDAISAIAELHQLAPQHPVLSQLVEEVTGPVVDQIQREIDAGRLDRMQQLLTRVRPLASLDPDLAEFEQVAVLGRRAAIALEQSQFHDALRTLRKLSSLIPGAGWLQSAIETTQTAADLTGRLQATPLALLNETVPEDSDGEFRLRPRTLRPVERERAAMAGTAGLDRLLLRVDGGGSALLLLSPTVSIGNVSQSTRCDIPLTGYQGTEPTLLARRRGGYQIVAGTDCVIDGMKCSEKLLASGAKVNFGPRCSFRFRRPTSISSSAVIELTGTRLAQLEARTVVLFEETVIIGPPGTSHLVNRSLELPLVLFQRDGQFFVRQGWSGQRAESPRPSLIPVNVGEAVEIGGARLLLSAVGR